MSKIPPTDDATETSEESPPKFVLGETDQEFVCFGEDDNRDIALLMLQQAEFKIDILSRYLDPAIYDTEECCDAIETLALHNPHAIIRILIHEPKIIAQRGHYLIYLMRKLGSLINCRAVPEPYKATQDTFLLVDDIGVMHRQSVSNITSSVNFKNHPAAKKLTALFDKIWHNSEPTPYTREIII
ncbi:MAG: hypothetical protein R3E08_11625 [Thiotrichaceae bacterium]